MLCVTCSRPVGECWSETARGPECLDCDNGRDPDELRAGDAVLWKRTALTGYWVPATVVRVGFLLVTISFDWDGPKEAMVKPEHLKRRKAGAA